MLKKEVKKKKKKVIEVSFTLIATEIFTLPLAFRIQEYKRSTMDEKETLQNQQNNSKADLLLSLS